MQPDNALNERMARRRLAHAYLITGRDRAVLADTLAAALVCTGDAPPCGACTACRKTAQGIHPDVMKLDPEGEGLKAEAVRALRSDAYIRPNEAAHKVYILCHSELLNPTGQNILLKLIEEGPAYAAFLFLTPNPELLLPTIRSRCRCVRLQPWSEKRVEDALLQRHVPPDRAKALSRYCEGSLGRALQMQEDETYWQARETVRRGFLSVTSAAGLSAAVQVLKDQKDNGDRLLDILEQEVRALMRVRAANTADGADDFPSPWREAPPQALRRILEAVFAARRQKNANVGWAALSEGLLQTIAEEATKWQV